MKIRGFYAIVDDEAPVEALLRGGAPVVQLRRKGAGARELLDLARLLRARTRGRALFIVDDRPDIALLADADGVHVGQDDLPLDATRRVVGARLVGVSTHSLAQARDAEAGGADYIGFGPIFPTASKERPDPVVGVDALAEVCRVVRVPVVAIGGVTPANVALVVAAGAAAAVSIAGVLRAADVEAAARAMARAFSAR
ncbi:MAG: thiamine phosphate synthase [Myxococcota bacterium]